MLCSQESYQFETQIILFARSAAIITVVEDDGSFKPGLHTAGRIAEHVCDDASKRILKLSKYRLKKFLVKYHNL